MTTFLFIGFFLSLAFTLTLTHTPILPHKKYDRLVRLPGFRRKGEHSKALVCSSTSYLDETAVVIFLLVPPSAKRQSSFSETSIRQRPSFLSLIEPVVYFFTFFLSLFIILGTQTHSRFNRHFQAGKSFFLSCFYLRVLPFTASRGTSCISTRNEELTLSKPSNIQTSHIRQCTRSSASLHCHASIRLSSSSYSRYLSQLVPWPGCRRIPTLVI